MISDKESRKIKFFSLKDLLGSEAEQQVRKLRKALFFERVNIEAKRTVLAYNFLRSKRKRNVVLTLSRTRQKRPGCSKILEERSEAKGIGPILSKNEGKTNRCIPKILENETERSELFKNFTRSKQNEHLR